MGQKRIPHTVRLDNFWQRPMIKKIEKNHICIFFCLVTFDVVESFCCVYYNEFYHYDINCGPSECGERLNLDNKYVTLHATNKQKITVYV